MEVTDWLHVPSALSPWEDPPVLMEQQVGTSPEPVSMVCRKKQILTFFLKKGPAAEATDAPQP